MHTLEEAEKIMRMESNTIDIPKPEAKPIADYIHLDENGREYLVITNMIKKDDRYGYEQYRRYLEPLNEEDAHRVFLPFTQI